MPAWSREEHGVHRQDLYADLRRLRGRASDIARRSSQPSGKGRPRDQTMAQDNTWRWRLLLSAALLRTAYCCQSSRSSARSPEDSVTYAGVSAATLGLRHRRSRQACRQPPLSRRPGPDRAHRRCAMSLGGGWGDARNSWWVGWQHWWLGLVICTRRHAVGTVAQASEAVTNRRTQSRRLTSGSQTSNNDIEVPWHDDLRQSTASRSKSLSGGSCRRQAFHGSDIGGARGTSARPAAGVTEAGLDGEEAFLVAVKRMGSLDAVSASRTRAFRAAVEAVGHRPRRCRWNRRTPTTPRC